MKRILALALAALTLCACASAQSGLNAEKKPATDITAQKNAHWIGTFSGTRSEGYAFAGDITGGMGLELHDFWPLLRALIRLL